MRNAAVIGGRLFKRSAIRYTPAGVPIVDFVIAHNSVQNEAGGRRKVQCDIDAVAIGELAARIDGLKLNQGLQVTGFLARNTIGNKKLMLHATKVETAGDAE
ncbi:MAG: primosomal replication protein N [Betaproteobacteria bacterium]|jgi:primosomal replication protein N|nr:primosomal replication protein N [Betaproteobacteria bacterium]